jgi:predicted DNA-binding protein
MRATDSLGPAALGKVAMSEQCQAGSVIPGYTGLVKTAISIPDETYERASRQAKGLGMSRSEFFSRAVARYVDELESESLTRQIDEVLAATGEPDGSTLDATQAGRTLLAGITDAW